MADPEFPVTDVHLSTRELHVEIARLAAVLDDLPPDDPSTPSLRERIVALDRERTRRRREGLEEAVMLGGSRRGEPAPDLPYGERTGPNGQFILYRPTLAELARAAADAPARPQEPDGFVRLPFEAEPWPEEWNPESTPELLDEDPAFDDASPRWIVDISDDEEDEEDGEEFAEEQQEEEEEGPDADRRIDEDDPALERRRQTRHLVLRRLNREHGRIFEPPEGDLADDDVFEKEMEKAGWTRSPDGDWVETPPPPPPPPAPTNRPRNWGQVDTPTKLVEALKTVIAGGKLDDRILVHLSELIEPENLKTMLKMIAFFAFLQAMGLPVWAVAAVGFGMLVMMFGADFIALGGALLAVTNARTQAEFDEAVDALTDAFAKLGVDFFTTLVTMGFSRYIASRRPPTTALARRTPPRPIREPRVPIKATIDGKPVQAWLEFGPRGRLSPSGPRIVPPSRQLPGPTPGTPRPTAGGINQPRRWSGPLPSSPRAVPGPRQMPPLLRPRGRPPIPSGPRLIGMHPPGSPIYYLPRSGWWVRSVRMSRATKRAARSLYRAIFGESIPKGFQLRHVISKRLLAATMATFTREQLIVIITQQLPAVRGMLRAWGSGRWGATRWSRLDPRKFQTMPHEQLAKIALDLLYNDIRFIWAGSGGQNMFLGRQSRGGLNTWSNYDIPRGFDEFMKFLGSVMVLSQRPRGRPPKLPKAKAGGRRRVPGSSAAAVHPKTARPRRRRNTF